MKFFNRSKSKKKERIMVRENRHKKREKKYTLNWGYFGLLFITWLLTSLIIYGIGMRSTRLTGIAVGQRATRSIVAAQDFVCENLTETDLLRSRAEKDTPIAFELSSKPWTDTERFLTHLETRLLQLRQSTPERVESSQSSLRALLDFVGIKLTVDQFSGLSDELKIQGSLMVLSQVSKEILTKPLVDQADKKERFSGVVNSSVAIYSKDKLIETVKLGNILTIESARHEFVFKSQKLIPNSVISKAVLTAIADRFITENLRYNQAKSADLKKEAFDKVEPIKEVVIAGTQIVEAHEIITPQILLQLRAHEAQLNESEPVTQKILRIFGGSILLLAALLATVGASKTISNDWQKKYREITLMVILSLITLLFSKLLVFWAGRTGIIDPSSISFLLPQALAPLLVTILIGPRYGIICGIWVSIATGILFELSFGIFMLGFLVTIIGARMGCRVKNNSSVFRAEALVMLTKMLFVIIQGILLHPNIQVIFNQLAATGISVVVSTCFIILTIPLFETAFKFTSNIRLLELSDMTHPLLQRLAIEAPGTYHHSLMVSNVASQAAEKIGANFLLVRVAAYFHDIGKMVKPGFFTENIQYRDNPHDELTPSMSTLVIMSHVKEGVELARRYRLPEQIISAIRDHHGTGLVSYFYHRAKVQAEENGTTVNKDDFRYPGPLPVSKEMAILMLADSVEAASRSLEKPTPNKITTLVNEIVDAKIKDGQLDNSLLTLAQLTEIKQSFIFTLTNMLHGRVAYPKDGNNDSKPAK